MSSEGLGDNAYTQAQSVGKTPSLCVPGSTYLASYNTCLNCLQENGSSNTSAIGPQFDDYIEYCATLDALVPVPITTTLFATVSDGVVVSVTVSYTSTKVSSGYLGAVSTTTSGGNSTLASSTSSTSTSQTSSASAASLSSTSSSSTLPETGPPTQSNNSWIAGPIVGSLVVSALLAYLGYQILRRKGRGKNEDMGYVKPELHGDDVPQKPPEELEAPPPPAELDWGGFRASELDSGSHAQTTTLLLSR
ncbi:hypothetical protein GE09DRAFT_561682 [Coniochaeta sp. 2T2.1]|nr:hypothetical protein GE09DRAFT_561682 [Coniochaeta sp. 2T2.1]